MRSKRGRPDGAITIFDNGNMNEVEQSRGIVLELGENAMTAKLVREYTHPDKVRAATRNAITYPCGRWFGVKVIGAGFGRTGTASLKVARGARLRSWLRPGPPPRRAEAPE